MSDDPPDRTPPLPPDVLVLLTEEHLELRRLFDEVESSPPELAGVRYGYLRTELVHHDLAEEMVVFPYLRPLASYDEVLETCINGQAEMEEQMSLLDGLGVSAGEFRRAVRDLHAHALRHMEVEENELFPALADAAGEVRVALAEQFTAAKRRAPSRPHPHLPAAARPLVQPLVSLVDGLRDLASGQP